MLQAGIMQGGGGGDWAVYYTNSKSFEFMFSYSLDLQFWGLLLNFD